MNLKRIVVLAVSLAIVCCDISPAQAAIVDTRPPGSLVRSSAVTFAHTNTWLYGDSITVQTWRNLHLSGGLAVDAKWGRTAGLTVDKLMIDLRNVKHLPKVVIVAAGTNDFATHADLTYAVARARHQATKMGFWLVWVNVYVDTRTDAWELNHIIDAGGPVVHVADWSGLLIAHRDPVTGTSPWLRDGIHVNEVGAIWRTNLLRRAMVR